MSAPYVRSANVAGIQESATIAVSQRARALRAEGRTIIDLGAGEPDFDTPEFIRNAAKSALDAGATRYTAVEGIPSLREAIAVRTNAETPGVSPVVPAEVIVSTGSKQCLFNACFALFGPGDEVLVPTPSWTSYYEMVNLSRATCVEVLGDAANGFKVSAKMLAAAATPRTRGVMLNSPSNPTGAVYSADELRAILALAAERGWWVISDEIYRRISYETPAVSALQVAEGRDRLVVIDGVAKAYAMTGWRVGWAIAQTPVIRAMSALQSHTTSNVTTVSQHAAVAALSNRDEAEPAITHMVGEYRRRRDAGLAELRKAPGLRHVHPGGAFYFYVDVSGTSTDVRGAHAGVDVSGTSTDITSDPGGAFCTRLLDEAGIAIVPGSAFHTPGWVRISYAAKLEHVVTGVRAVVELAQRMAHGASPALSG